MSIKAAIYVCKVGHTFYHCSREREANVLDHKGCNSNATNEECCLLMRLKQQPKQSPDGGTIFMQGCLWSCPPRHLSHHHSITVCLHYLRSWMNRGSGLSLGSSGGPALPPVYPFPLSHPSLCTLPPPTTPPQPSTCTQTEPWSRLLSLSLSLAHINWSNGRVLVLSASYLWQILKSFVAESLHHQGTISCSRGRGATHRAMSAAADLLKPRALRKSTY